MCGLTDNNLHWNITWCNRTGNENDLCM